MHHSGFGHGIFATQPSCLIHDGGQDQNWGRRSRVAGLLRAGHQSLDARFWDAPQPEALALPSTLSGQGRFAGHHHSHTAALLGLLYYSHAQRDAEAIEFVRKSYENLRAFGIARVGLFGEGCTVGDMTYLAVRLSQWGVGDYWEDVDQYVRNHLTELQLRDPARLDAIVREKGRPLVPSDLGDWAQGLDTNNVVARCRGLFWSDATHPTLIPIREEAPAAGTCLQWVVCCSGNCTKALHEVWSGMVEHDAASRFTRIHLLFNRASSVLDVESHLPHEGKVILRLKQTGRVAVRIPRWVETATVSIPPIPVMARLDQRLPRSCSR